MISPSVRVSMGPNLAVPEDGRDDDRVLSVGTELSSLFPRGGLHKGGVFALSGATGATSVLFALLAGALTNGLWAGVLGISTFGVEAAFDFGVPLQRVVLVPRLDQSWLEVVAIMLGSCEMVALCPPQGCTTRQTRALADRARVHNAVLLVVAPENGQARLAWPSGVDGRIEVLATRWRGLDKGFGALSSREVELQFSGRHGDSRPLQLRCLLPGSDGAVHRVQRLIATAGQRSFSATHHLDRLIG